MAEPNDDDRLDADRFLGRYGEGPPRAWERADLVAFIAELRERYQGPEGALTDEELETALNAMRGKYAR